MSASCPGAPGAQEAVVVLHGSSKPVVADVTDPAHPRTICTLTGNWQPQLVTQAMLSWSATQNPGSPGPSVIVTLALATGTSAVVASWLGGAPMDGMLAWSPDQGTIAYVTSDANAVNLHLLSGGGDRVVATLGAVPARGVNPSQDDAFLAFSPNGEYFAFVQTFSGSGDHVQVRRTADGSIVYSHSNGTMATWASTGNKLYFRQDSGTIVNVWDPATGVSQAFAQPAAWIAPRADAGDDYIAYTVRDSAGIPHVWLYGHGGRDGGELPNVRSTPVFLNAGNVFMLEEAPCGATCGPGPATQPDEKTFTYDIAGQAETPSTITWVYGAWPRPGQV